MYYKTATTLLQHTFSVNEAFFGDNLTDIFFITEAFRSDVFKYLYDLVEDTPLATRLGMWFVHDGAPTHFSRNAGDYLYNAYVNEPVKWPPVSPDLTPLRLYR